MKVSSVVMVSACLLSGCAALIAPRTAFVPVTSQPQGGEVFIDGASRGRTPLTLELDPRRSYTLVVKKPGLPDRTFELRNEIGAGWVIADVLLGVWPILVDALTNSWYMITPEPVQIVWSDADQAPRVVQPPAPMPPS